MDTGRDPDTSRTNTTTRVIDPHQHFWGSDALAEQSWRTGAHATISRSFEPSDLRGELASAGVDATVVIQSMDSSEENRRLRRYADETDFVAGVVAWLPLAEREQAVAELDALDGMPMVRGVRCLIGQDPLDWLRQDAALRTFRQLADRGLCWDVVPITASQADNVSALAAAVPQLTLVMDHMARPPVDAGGWQPWADQVARLAEHQNVVMKLSVGVDVLTAWPEWQAPALVRYVSHVMSSFGPDRIMLASNWPVVLLRQDYVTAWRDLEACVRDLGLAEHELAQIKGGTAERCYRLSPA